MTFHGRQTAFAVGRGVSNATRSGLHALNARGAGKECSGYRDEKLLVFRNENERIIREVETAKGQALVKGQSPSTGSETSSALEESVSRLDTQGLAPVLARPMSITVRDIDEHGLLFFAHNFSSAPFFDGSFANLHRKTLFEEVELDASLRNSIISIGLAAMSNTRKRYGVTLNEVRRTVANLSYANVTSLLRTILMLAIFEMVGAKPDSLSLGKAEGTAHLAGVHMIMKRFPQFASPGDEIWPGFELMDIFLKFIRLCASLPHYQAVNAEEEVLREALDLELEFQLWNNRVPADWSVTIREDANLPGTFYGQYHVYRSAWAPRVLNHYYLCRLLVNELILVYIAKLEAPSAAWAEQQEQSLSVIGQLATDICAGIAT
ncbi:hypothetical protein BJX64DRAFT_282712 [Aspergillus heterothallicus]